MKHDWEDRFWSKVDKNGPVQQHCPELGPCWVWLDVPNDSGYGLFGIRYAKWRYVKERAHRVSFFLKYGRWPKPCGLHRCDNRLCVRPDHIFEGTLIDNILDASAKGRLNGPKPGHQGEKNRNAKLTWDIVDSIRRESKEIGTSSVKLGKRYGVAHKQIWAVLHEKTWKPENRPQL